MKTTTLLAIVMSLMLTAAACGGSEGDGEADTAAQDNAADEGRDVETDISVPTDQLDSRSEDGGGSGNGPGNLQFPGPSGTGTFTVDGDTFTADFVGRCEPFDASDFGGAPAHEDDLSIIAGSGGTYLNLDISYQEAAGFTTDLEYTATSFRPMLSLTGGSGIEQFEGYAIDDLEGNWYVNLIPMLIVEGQPPTDDPLPPPTGLTVDGDHVTGALTLDQTWPDGESGVVEVAFDLTIPSEEVDCSL